ncbi:response regulator transcription factor [Nocardioides sp. Kera G14]|uniref:response regulator transcription factor n=1 Tax=Nocardioides sp. Kera G14 TaxID=2884264 RepID=UPI001D118B82|nr:response regulator transcription factor [Nocardioides sp. Kera G14]UDY25164.1 response regulator transcription factor [Nocardioides sp. Kera G14]
METGRKIAVIVEDDPDVRNLLRTVLTQSGFEPVLTSNGEDGVAAVKYHNPVLTTLDVSMPGMDGVAAAAAIREFSDTYIIMITAQDDEIDVVSGLNAGADEYISKPFRPRELRARISSLLRRSRGVSREDVPEPVDDGLWRRETALQQPHPEPVQPPPAVPPVAEPGWQPVAHPAPQPAPYPAPQPAPEVHQTVPAWTESPSPEPMPYTPAVAPAAGHPLATDQGLYSHRGLLLHTASGQVTVDGAGVSLSPEEFGLLKALMSSGRRVRSKADLVLSARGESYVTSYFVTEHDKRVIDQQVASLRRKLRDEGTPSRWIETVDNVGYRMTP